MARKKREKSKMERHKRNMEENHKEKIGKS